MLPCDEEKSEISSEFYIEKNKDKISEIEKWTDMKYDNDTP